MSLNIYNIILVFGTQFQSPLQELLDVEFIPLVKVGSELVIRVFCQIVFVGKERTDTS